MRCDMPLCWNKGHHDVTTSDNECFGLCCLCWHRYLDHLHKKPHATSVSIDKRGMSNEKAVEIALGLMHGHLEPIPTRELFALFHGDRTHPLSGFSERMDRVLSEMKDTPGPHSERWLHLLTNANPLPEESHG